MSQWRYNTTRHQIIFCACCLVVHFAWITYSLLEGHLIVGPRRKWVSCACHSAWPCYLVGVAPINQMEGLVCRWRTFRFVWQRSDSSKIAISTIWRCSWWRCRRARNEASTGFCEGCIDFFAQRKNSKRHGKVTNFESLTSWNTEPILPIRRLRRAVCLAWQLLNLNTSDLDIIGITITGIRSNDQSTQSHHRSRHHGSYPGSRSHLQAADLDETDEFCCEDLSIWCT